MPWDSRPRPHLLIDHLGEDVKVEIKDKLGRKVLVQSSKEGRKMMDDGDVSKLSVPNANDCNAKAHNFQSERDTCADIL